MLAEFTILPIVYCMLLDLFKGNRCLNKYVSVLKCRLKCKLYVICLRHFV